MMNDIRHNYPSLIHCLRAFHIMIFAKLPFRCYCYHRYRYFHTTLLLNTLLQILSLSGVVELTTQVLILENILWLPLCRINKFGLNTLPSKTVAIPYTCGLSRLTRDTVFVYVFTHVFKFPINTIITTFEISSDRLFLTDWEIGLESEEN